MFSPSQLYKFSVSLSPQLYACPPNGALVKGCFIQFLLKRLIFVIDVVVVDVVPVVGFVSSLPFCTIPSIEFLTQVEQRAATHPKAGCRMMDAGKRMQEAG